MGRFLFVCMVLAYSVSARAAVIDFEDVAPPPSGDIVFNPIISGGFRFAPGSGHQHINDATAYTNNGTQWYAFHSTTVVMTRNGGGAFDLGSLQIAEYDNDTYATAVHFNATLVGGGTLSATVAMDGIFDGAGSLNDFQSVLLNWSNVLSLSISGSGSDPSNWIVLDNIGVELVNAVPAPAPWTLLVLPALVPLVGRRRRANAPGAAAG